MRRRPRRPTAPDGSRRCLLVLAVLTAGCLEVRPDGDLGGSVPGERPPPVARPAPPPPAHVDVLGHSVHRGINDYRESRGLRALELDEDFSELAEEHSRGMASGDVPFGHSGFEGRAMAIRREGAYRSVAENVGYNRGARDPAADAVERWLRSPQHRANVIGDFEETGVGVAMNSRGEYYFTQIFVKPAR